MLKYVRWPGNNFGDNLNDVIFESLGITDRVDFKKSNLGSLDENCLLGLGTIINRKIHSPCTVVGSGCNGSSKPSADIKYSFVRGRLTAEFLGLHPSAAAGDLAYYLLPWAQALAESSKDADVGIVPHWKTSISGPNVIHPDLPVKDFVKAVSRKKMILAEAMHGAICADMLRIPFAPVSIGGDIDSFKWLDWASMLDINLEFGDLNNHHFCLSSDSTITAVHQAVKNRLLETIDCFS